MVVRIADFQAGDGCPFFLIAGPCVIESEEVVLGLADELGQVCRRLEIPLVFKASYDKANRTSVESFRGPGLDEGLEILAGVKRRLGLPVTSDVHLPADIPAAAEVLDIIQVPAFLSRQTDMLVEAGRTGRVVNVKKGQFLAPEDTAHFPAKVSSAAPGGEARLLITERGTTFGYHDLVVDFRGFQVMSGFAPVVFDATHSVQQPGGAGTRSGGRREFVPLLVRAALAAGCAGIFLEVHRDPGEALSDGPNMVSLVELPELLARAKEYDALARRGS